MGTNESLHAWMDEGFTSWAEGLTTHWLRGQKGFALQGDYNGYFNLARSGREEPMTTHADHYKTNFAYSAAAYTKGAVYLGQLGYIMGDSLLIKTMLEYYRVWKFKHPNPTDFTRIAEKVSGIQLAWYTNYWAGTTRIIDYSIDSLWTEGGNTLIRLQRAGDMPMPLDVRITFKDSSTEQHYVPLDLMFGAKPAEDSLPRKVYPPQRWTHRDVIISTPRRITDMQSVEIDPSNRLADIDRRNNKLELKW
jgi:aminopeptidase N